jgi:TRAP-type mannitol/chloroaromatic compound transport system permease large subunit
VCGKDLLLHRIIVRIMRSSLEQGHTMSHLMILRVYDMMVKRLLVTIPSFHILALALRQHTDELRLCGSQVLFTLHELLLHMLGTLTPALHIMCDFRIARQD